MRRRRPCLCQEIDRGAVPPLTSAARATRGRPLLGGHSAGSEASGHAKFPPKVKAVTRGPGPSNMLDRRGLVHHLGTNKSHRSDRRSDPCVRRTRRCDEHVSQPVMEPSSPVLAEAPRTLRNACASAAARPDRPGAPPRASLRRSRAPRRARRAARGAPRRLCSSARPSYPSPRAALTLARAWRRQRPRRRMTWPRSASRSRTGSR